MMVQVEMRMSFGKYGSDHATAGTSQRCNSKFGDRLVRADPQNIFG